MTYQAIQSAGLIYGPQYHHLESLGSLCSFLDIPLIITDPVLARLASYYFPTLVVFEKNYHEVSRFVLENYPYIISGLSRVSLKSIFFLTEKMFRKPLVSIWYPHPSILNSSEFLSEDLFSKEHALLIEGDKLFEGYVVDRVFPPQMPIIRAGPLRMMLYEKHKPYYQNLIQKELKKPLNRQNVSILYSSISEINLDFHLETLLVLIEQLPEKINLIVLEDPKYPIEFAMEIKKLSKKYESHERIFFLSHVPFPIPLLEIADIFLGDYSSLAFDFLYFNKPLFLLDSKKFAFQDLTNFADVLSQKSLAHLYTLLLNQNEPGQKSLFEEKKHHYLTYFTSSIALDHLKQHVDSAFKQIQFISS